MQPEIKHPDGAADDRQPYCSGPASHCLTYKMAAFLGSNIQDILTSFIEGAEDGACLTLQKNRSGFTVKVVGAVRRSAGTEALDGASCNAASDS